MENSTKLKDSTFAIIAEKKDSISHKWFEELRIGIPRWLIGDYCKYSKGRWGIYEDKPEGIPIYTESEFEALLKAEEFNEGVDLQRQSAERMINLKPKAEQENEKPKYANFDEWREMGKKEMLHTNDNAPTTPKQITISYNLAIEYIAERLNVDKGIIKIEMP